MNEKIAQRIDSLPESEQQLVYEWINSQPTDGTMLGYLIEIEKLIGWLQQPMIEATSADLDNFKSYLENRSSDDKKPLSVNGQRRTLAAIRSYYSYLLKHRKIHENPAMDLSLPKDADKIKERIITEEEYFILLTTEKNPRNKLLIELLYATGGRITEALSARWSDTHEHEHGGQITYFGKGSKTRHVIIPKTLWIKLLAYRGEAADDGYIFPSPRNESQPLSSSQAWRVVRAVAAKTTIGKRVSPHWFRHAHASHALDRGASVSLVMETLGHADLSTTTRYVHANKNDSSSLYLPVK